MAATTLTSKGQITLPKAIRDRLALVEGDRLRVDVDAAGRLTLEREQRPPIADAYGLLRKLAGKRPVSLPAMRAAVKRRARRRLVGQRT